ncbi:MAG: hypothetical protein ABSA93_16280 [Streptosporangiaceae bacterium]|jgi:hypothetical protein
MLWIGGVILLVVVLPVVIYLLNRVLAACERIRDATSDILDGGVALIGELDGLPGRAGHHRRHHHGGIRGRGPLRRLSRETTGGVTRCPRPPT